MFGFKCSKYVLIALFISCALLFFIFNKDQKDISQSKSQIIVATSGEYPPFEFYNDGVLSGFDIDLARLIGKKIGKDIVFEDMQFSSTFAALSSGKVDVVISAVTSTPERLKNFDFSEPYHSDVIAIIFKENNIISDWKEINRKKIACQLGSRMELWSKKTLSSSNEIVTIDDNNKAIESLKSGHVDFVVLEKAQGLAFSSRNSNLKYITIAGTESECVIAFRKGDKENLELFNIALRKLIKNGEIDKLRLKWFGKKSES